MLSYIAKHQEILDEFLWRLYSFRRNLTHLHDWEYDEGEWKEMSSERLSWPCWLCTVCCATTSPKRKPLRWSLFHKWN